MSVPYQPQNLSVEQADGNILLSWDGALNATSYQVQRSTDGVNFSIVGAASIITQYLDPLPGVGIMYWYQVLAVNSSGSSIASAQVQMVASPPSEMSLYELRLRAQQTADRKEANFIPKSEWNAFARLALYELYDLLVTSYEDLFASSTVTIPTNGSQNYALPNGVSNYLGSVYGGASGQPAPALYKLSGVDLSLNSSTLNPAWVSLPRFNFADRNKFVFPNAQSTLYGKSNLSYRLMGTNINFIPLPSSGQTIRLWYTPKLPQLLSDTDTTTLGFSGWLRYPIVRMAKYCLDKEESNSQHLDQELMFLKTRIEQSSQNRDSGQADTISDTRRDQFYQGPGW